jgi:glycosyltransferase involved in cell wall biosynthesis
MTPKVAVNIVTFNSAGDIAACLESLRHQTFTDFEIHILDNASSDDTLKIIARDAPRNSGCVPSPVNTGFCKAHNDLVRRFPSEYVLFLNPDTVLSPTFIEELVRALDARPDAASASGKLLRMDGKTIDSTGIINPAKFSAPAQPRLCIDARRWMTSRSMASTSMKISSPIVKTQTSRGAAGSSAGNRSMCRVPLRNIVVASRPSAAANYPK